MTDPSMAPIGEALLHAFAPSLGLPVDGEEPSPAGRDGEPGEPPAIDGAAVRHHTVVDGIAVTLADPSTGRHQLLFASSNLAAMLGYPVDQLVGLALPALFGDDNLAQLEAIEARLATERQLEATHLLRHKSGRTVAVRATHAALPSVHPRARYRLILFRDLTRPQPGQLLADQSVLVDSLARGQDLGSLCQQVARHVEDKLAGVGRCWVGISDLDDQLEAVAAGGQDPDLVSRVLQLVMEAGDQTCPRCVLVDHLPAGLRGPLRKAAVRSLWAFPAVDVTGRQQGALVVAHHSEDVPTDAEVQFLDHLSQVIAAGIERAAIEAELAHRGLHDPLTHLPNRALIMDRVTQALARLDREQTSLSVLLVDIDRFKSVNDSWGSDVGDQVLVEVARRLVAAVRLGDTVGRIASDQFLLLCSAADLDGSAVARRVISALAQPIRLDDGSRLRITASVGVVAVDDPHQSPAAVISQAESALDRAEEIGRGRFALYDEGLQHEAVARHELEQALHSAIEASELVLHYQPVCEIATGRMIGAEALVRWERPGHGLLGPGEFIGVAEETGLIVQLGAWVIDEVASHLAIWPKSSGWSPVISVNLSARQLADESLVPGVKAALERHDLPAGRLGFEVTESMRVDDFEAAIDTLNELSRLGCRIAVDDFGIGYATLDYLRRFSMADVIKIDRTFIAGLGHSREDTAIVNASMALASSLKLRVVAEGVENFAQLDQLANLGCHYAQGFALSAGVPVGAAIRLWRAGKLFEPPSAGTGSRLAARPAGLRRFQSGTLRGRALITGDSGPRPGS